MLADGKDVWIYSARATSPETVSAIKAWTKEHLGKELPVTNLKHKEFAEFYDDKYRPLASQAGATGEKPATKYEYGNTQANIPEDSAAAEALESARNRIADSDLAGDGKDIGTGGS